jgi:deoxyribose-phosphate aldolase
MVLQIVMLPGADLVRGMTGIEPTMSTAASLALMTAIAAALGRCLNLNR